MRAKMHENKSEVRVKVGRYTPVFKGVIFTIEQARAKMPSGKIVTYERERRKPVVIIVAIDDKKRVIITREYRLEHKRTLWWLPAGFIEQGQRPINAARRELLEETGYYAKTLRQIHKTMHSGVAIAPVYYFLATGLERHSNDLEENEDIRVFMRSIDEIFAMILDGKFTDARHVFILMKLYALMKRRRLQ